jgi:hypothetical protein
MKRFERDQSDTGITHEAGDDEQGDEHRDAPLPGLTGEESASTAGDGGQRRRRERGQDDQRRRERLGAERRERPDHALAKLPGQP